MSTRCNIIVEDGRSRIQIYRHSDGYPNSQHGVLATLEEVFEYAWTLPRFEADDFAAAIIAAWKQPGGGNIRIDGNPEGDELLHSDIEYLYTITRHADGDGIQVVVTPQYDSDSEDAGIVKVMPPKPESEVNKE